MRNFFQHEHSVIDAARRLAEHANGTAEHMFTEELEDLAAWLRWRVGEGWQPHLGDAPQPRTQHYDSLVRVLAGEALDLYEAWALENGLRDPEEGD